MSRINVAFLTFSIDFGAHRDESIIDVPLRSNVER